MMGEFDPIRPVLRTATPEALPPKVVDRDRPKREGAPRQEDQIEIENTSEDSDAEAEVSKPEPEQMPYHLDLEA